MAKMLDALARAQRERQQTQASTVLGEANIQQVPAPQPVVAETARFEQPPATPSQAAQPAYSDTPAVYPAIDEQVIAAHDTRSPIVEQVRQIRTNLETVLSGMASRPIVISSPISGDGKSLFSANLAWVLADNMEHKAVLIDADMRKPDQNRLFGVRRSPGLSEYLREQCTLDQAIHPTGMANLSIIPGGRTPESPTSLLSMHRLPELIEALKERFTWIVFDTPPLLPVTDAALIARHCAGLVLVVRMGQTHRKVIERSQELLAEMRLPVLGCVLNEFAPERTTDHHYSRYYAYGAKYGENP